MYAHKDKKIVNKYTNELHLIIQFILLKKFKII